MNVENMFNCIEKSRNVVEIYRGYEITKRSASKTTNNNKYTQGYYVLGGDLYQRKFTTLKEAKKAIDFAESFWCKTA